MEAFSERLDGVMVRDLLPSADGNTKSAVWSDVSLQAGDGKVLLPIETLIVTLTRTQNRVGTPICLATIRIVPREGSWRTASTWNAETGQAFQIEVLNDQNGSVVEAQTAQPALQFPGDDTTPVDVSTQYDVAVYTQTHRTQPLVNAFRWVKR